MPSLRPSALREACVCLCASVQAEARAISRPEIVSSLALLSSQLHTVPPPSIAAPLCSLVYHLLRGVPTRLSREAVGVLGRVEGAGVSFSEQLLSEGAASSLFMALLHHGNREVCEPCMHAQELGNMGTRESPVFWRRMGQGWVRGKAVLLSAVIQMGSV